MCALSARSAKYVKETLMAVRHLSCVYGAHWMRKRMMPRGRGSQNRNNVRDWLSSGRFGSSANFSGRDGFALTNAIPGNDCRNCSGTGQILNAWTTGVCSVCQKCKKCDGDLNGHSSSVLCLQCTQVPLISPPITAVPTSKVPPINKAMEKKDDAVWARFAGVVPLGTRGLCPAV